MIERLCIRIGMSNTGGSRRYFRFREIGKLYPYKIILEAEFHVPAGRCSEVEFSMQSVSNDRSNQIKYQWVRHMESRAIC